MPDAKLSYFGNTNFFDISLKDGDIELDDSFNTALIVSLFSDARADESEVRKPENRRGFWGDEISDDTTDKFGSKLWLLFQSRLTTNTVTRANDYAKLALNWLIINGYSKIINIAASRLEREALGLNIAIINSDNSVEQKYYKLWRNTGDFKRSDSNLAGSDLSYLIDNDGNYIFDDNGAQIILRQ